MTKIVDLPEFDMAAWLPDEASVAEYLTVVTEENDPAALAKALGTIARACGMSEVAAKARIGRRRYARLRIAYPDLTRSRPE